LHIRAATAIRPTSIAKGRYRPGKRAKKNPAFFKAGLMHFKWTCSRRCLSF